MPVEAVETKRQRRTATPSLRRVKLDVYKTAGEDQRDLVGTVYLREMDEADGEERTRLLTERRVARKRGAGDDEMQLHIERIRMHDFAASVLHWDLLSEVLDEEGEVVYEDGQEPEYFTEDDTPEGRPILDKYGEKMVAVEGVPKVRALPLSPKGFRRLSQSVGEQIQRKIREINDIPEDDEYDDLKSARKGRTRASLEVLEDERDSEEGREADPDGSADPTSGT